MTAYVTQYALSQGILKVEGTLEEQMQLIPGLAPDKKDTRLVWFDKNGHKRVYRMESENWHRSFEAAKARALAMRDNKLRDLSGIIASLVDMSFDSPVETD